MTAGYHCHTRHKPSCSNISVTLAKLTAGITDSTAVISLRQIVKTDSGDGLSSADVGTSGQP